MPPLQTINLIIKNIDLIKLELEWIRKIGFVVETDGSLSDTAFTKLHKRHAILFTVMSFVVFLC